MDRRRPRAGDPLLAVVYLPVTDELYVAAADEALLEGVWTAIKDAEVEDPRL